MKEFIHNYGWVLPLIPMMGALLNGFAGGRLLKKYGEKTVGAIASGSVFLSFLFSLVVFVAVSSAPGAVISRAYTWLDAGNLKVEISFLFDPLSAVMLLIITGIGFLIHVYSTGYMKGDPGFARFFSYLNLFVFSMLVLVLADNIILMFVGWEGVGLCSYLLIGFWYADAKNAVAGNKAFIVNRVGDFGFILGMFLLFWTLKDSLALAGKVSDGISLLSFPFLAENVSLLGNVQLHGFSAVTLICLCFFVGATGKSAQIPLYVWLPDAMAGPTPVSALIHAATMVTAGVYMIGRLNFLFSMSSVALAVIAVTGAATAFTAATIGCVQNDIKKALAYSTVSQLGYMFLAMGVGAYSAGVFHLMTHAFFKACLFLGAGSVILGMHHEQDMRWMGGLRKYMPKTFITFGIATIAIAGIPPFSGFFSKDEILWAAWSGEHGHPLLWLTGFITAGLTAFYMTRVAVLTFFGENRITERPVDGHGREHDAYNVERHEIHESPASITIPLALLAFCATAAGFLGLPEALGGSNLFSRFLGPVMGSHGHSAPHDPMEYALMAASVAVAAGGMGAGYFLYGKRPDLPLLFARKLALPHKILTKKYYVDELYGVIFVSGTKLTSRFLSAFDRHVIDAVVNISALLLRAQSFMAAWFDNTFVDGIVNLVADSALYSGLKVRLMQTGKIQAYIMFLLAAVAAGIIYRVIS